MYTPIPIPDPFISSDVDYSDIELFDREPSSSGFTTELDSIRLELERVNYHLDALLKRFDLLLRQQEQLSIKPISDKLKRQVCKDEGCTTVTRSKSGYCPLHSKTNN